MKRLLPFLLAALVVCGAALAQDLTPNVVGGQYHTTPPTVTNGQTVGIQVDSHGVVAVSPGPSSASGAGVAYTSSAALAANQVVKASAGNLYSFDVSADSTLSAAAWWIMIYDAASAPVDGAVTPAKCYAMPAGTTGYAAAFFTPLRLGTGITIGVSTAGCFTKTASTHAFISGDAQ